MLAGYERRLAAIILLQSPIAGDQNLHHRRRNPGGKLLDREIKLLQHRWRFCRPGSHQLCASFGASRSRHVQSTCTRLAAGPAADMSNRHAPRRAKGLDTAFQWSLAARAASKRSNCKGPPGLPCAVTPQGTWPPCFPSYPSPTITILRTSVCPIVNSKIFQLQVENQDLRMAYRDAQPMALLT